MGGTLCLEVPLPYAVPQGATVSKLHISPTTEASVTEVAPRGQGFLVVDDISLWNVNDMILISQGQSDQNGSDRRLATLCANDVMVNVIVDIQEPHKLILAYTLTETVLAGGCITKVGENVTVTTTATTGTSVTGTATSTSSVTATSTGTSVTGTDTTGTSVTGTDTTGTSVTATTTTTTGTSVTS